MNDFLIYLLQVSVCQAAFYLLYHYLFHRISFFQTNRIFLLLAIGISFVIPALDIAFWNSGTVAHSFTNTIFSIPEIAITPQQQQFDVAVEVDLFSYFTQMLLLVYAIGGLFYLLKLALGIKRVINSVSNHAVEQHKGFKLVKIDSGPSFFSFWNYIFINEQKKELTKEELQQIINHEKVHVQQRHTVDIILAELAVCICWFNPFIRRIKQDLCQVHEFIADSQIESKITDIDKYAQLILRLASGNRLPLTHQFSMINIKNRIIMLHNLNTNKMKILRFLLVMPVIAVLLMAFSFTDKPVQIKDATDKQGPELLIGEIVWEGNTAYSDALLNKILDLKTGDVYDESLIGKAVTFDPARADVSSLYMDNGYLFFHIDIRKEIIDKTVNLTFKVFEGETAEIDQIIISGNKTVSIEDIKEMIELEKGDLFNRSKLNQSQKNIKESGMFDPDSILIKPMPKHGEGLVDIEFVVKEL